MDLTKFNTVIIVVFVVNIVLGMFSVLATGFIYSLDLEYNVSYSQYNINTSAFENGTDALETNPDLTSARSLLEVIRDVFFGIPTVVKQGAIIIGMPEYLYSILYYGLITLMSMLYIIWLIKLITLKI